jgi:hypothetical protein
VGAAEHDWLTGVSTIVAHQPGRAVGGQGAAGGPLLVHDDEVFRCQVERRLDVTTIASRRRAVWRRRLLRPARNDGVIVCAAWRRRGQAV